MKYTFLMTVGDNGTNIGFNASTDLGDIKRIAKQNNVPTDGTLVGRADIDLNADFRVATGSAKPLGSATHIVLTLEGYDVNTGTPEEESYGDPITLEWDGGTETYSAITTSSAQRASLLTFMQDNIGETIGMSITEYTRP